MRRILIVTDNRFWRRRMGSQVRIDVLHRHLLAAGSEILVLFVGMLYPEDREILASASPTLRVVNHETGFGEWRSRESLVRFRLVRSLKQAVPASARRALKGMLTRFIGGAAGSGNSPGRDARSPEPVLADMIRPEYRDLFRHICRQIQPDIVLVEYVRLSYLVKGAREVLPEGALTLVDTHDVMHERLARFHQHGEAHELAISESEEAAALSLFDCIIAIQRPDAQTFRRLVPGARVIVAGHATRVARMDPTAGEVIRLSYLGSAMAPNKRAIEDFLQEVWPRLWRRFEGRIALNIYGTVCSLFDPAPTCPGVCFEGFRADLESVYRQTDIVINPVKFGGGLKIKNVEALAFCKPLVTTSIGAEGLEDGAGTAFLVSDETGAMADALAELIERAESRQRLADGAFAYAMANFSETATYRELDAVLFGKDFSRIRSTN